MIKRRVCTSSVVACLLTIVWLAGCGEEPLVIDPGEEPDIGENALMAPPKLGLIASARNEDSQDSDAPQKPRTLNPDKVSWLYSDKYIFVTLTYSGRAGFATITLMFKLPGGVYTLSPGKGGIDLPDDVEDMLDDLIPGVSRVEIKDGKVFIYVDRDKVPDWVIEPKDDRDGAEDTSSSDTEEAEVTPPDHTETGVDTPSADGASGDEPSSEGEAPTGNAEDEQRTPSGDDGSGDEPPSEGEAPTGDAEGGQNTSLIDSGYGVYDVDGDGQVDDYIRLMDVDGDGQWDLLYIYLNCNGKVLHGTKYIRIKLPWRPRGTLGDYNGDKIPDTCAIWDVNGDGIADRMYDRDGDGIPEEIRIESRESNSIE